MKVERVFCVGCSVVVVVEAYQKTMYEEDRCCVGRCGDVVLLLAGSVRVCNEM
jgi:hypothetical protein